ncbi:hypothetical protein B0A54_16929 [Friedmanniomyces endolithicus]|uniref:Rhodopsin domain-containing protein n=1 Tax=Friedmanniomyces endolithicus TaxID=329885 RepID=A0A4U0TZI1_9PEZI|nr:hypothetical protein B0A54_16929 [Friedmanniomyces endolithicus]
MTLDAGFNKTTSTDHRRRLWVITILSIIYTISVLIARLFGKYGLLWYDDATMGLAYCVAIIRWGIQMHAISDGLGANLAIANLLPNGQNIALVRPIKSRKHETDEHLADDITLSIVVFSHRIFSGNLNHEAAIFATVYGIVGVSGIASIIAASVDCHPSYYLLSQDGIACSSNTMRSVLICILDTLSEIATVAMPGLLVSKLQMQEAKKRMVYTVFAAL